LLNWTKRGKYVMCVEIDFINSLSAFFTIKDDSIVSSMKVYIFYDLHVINLVTIRRGVLRRFLIENGTVVLMKNLKHETKAKE